MYNNKELGHVCYNGYMVDDMRNKSEEYWKEKLTPEQYHILREKGTEQAFTGKYYNNHKSGMYVSVQPVGISLFSSDAKFESGSELAEF